jgi:PAS domain-containing protein
MMPERRQKSLLLILAREFAANMAMPVYIADASGHLVYFNEAAEEIAGGSFAETGEIPIDEWAYRLQPESLEGKALAREEMPGGIAFSERRSAHGTMRITGLDGRRRIIEATVFPLFGVSEDFCGIMGIFWEPH